MLLAADDASGDDAGARPTIARPRRTWCRRSPTTCRRATSKMLEYMELLAVFEASNRRMLPKKYETMSAEELAGAARDPASRVWQPEVTMDFFPNVDVSALQAEAIARGLYADRARRRGARARARADLDFYHDV